MATQIVSLDKDLNLTSKEIERNYSRSHTVGVSTEFQAFLLIIVEALIVIGNALTMLTVRWLRKHPLVVDVLIFSLSLADVLNALSSVTVAILMRFFILRGQEIPTVLCQMQGWCIVAFEMTSVLIISLICFDRLTAVVKPIWHRTHLTCTRTVKAVLLVTTFSYLVASFPLLGWDSYDLVDWLAMCLFNYGNSYAAFIAVFGYLQLLFVLISAIAIVHSLRKIAKRRRRLTGRYSPSRHCLRNKELMQMLRLPNPMDSQSRQLVKLSMVVVVLFYISWLPLVLSITIQQVSVMDVSNMVFLGSFLALSSPVANPFIYFLLWKRYRKAFIEMAIHTAGIVKCRHRSLISPIGLRGNVQPRKVALPATLPTDVTPLSRPVDSGSRSSLNVMIVDEQINLKRRKPPNRQRGWTNYLFQEESSDYNLDSCTTTFFLDGNCCMEQLGRTNDSRHKLSPLETYV